MTRIALCHTLQRGMLRRGMTGCALALGVMALAAGPAAACTIDNVPSATVEGRTAVLYDVALGAVNPARYAPFILPGSFSAGWTLHAAERPQGLSLTPRQRHAPWVWSFGDGTTARGHAVSHIYRAPGLYVLTVTALLSPHGEPFLFDRVLIQVRAPDQILSSEGMNLLNGSRFDASAPLFGGLLPLRREVDRGYLTLAAQTLAQIESSAWASIAAYWQHQRGALPAAYARIGGLLRQEGTALERNDQHRAAAIADALPRLWTAIMRK